MTNLFIFIIAFSVVFCYFNTQYRPGWFTVFLKQTVHCYKVQYRLNMSHNKLCIDTKTINRSINGL